MALALPFGCEATRSTPLPVVTDELRSELLRAPYVTILDSKVFGSSGTALVRNGGTQLIISPHELQSGSSGKFDLVLPNRVVVHSNYVVVSRVDGPIEASGWALLNIDPPASYDYADLREDFTTPIPPGDPVYTIFWHQPDTPPNRWIAGVDWGFIVRSGRVRIVPSPEHLDERYPLGEFLLTDDDWPPGSSGAPVFWYPPGSESPVVVGIVSATFIFTDWFGRIVERVGLVRRPHELSDLQGSN